MSMPGLNAPSRLHGVDLARGLAVLGMLAAHLLDIESFDGGRPETWIDLANGRSSILFATLAGVSIALVTGRTRPVTGPASSTARARLAVRAVLLWLMGVALIATGVPVYVILPAYAILFLLAVPLVTLRARALWILAGVLGLGMPWVQPFLNALPLWEERSGQDLALILGWQYPVTVWIAFLVAGMAAGRSDLRALRTQVTLLVGGAAAALIGYGLDAAASSPGLPDDPLFSAVWTAYPHSSGLLEVIGSGGFALATLAVCLLACRTPLTWLVLPLRAVGSMPLTAYVGQLVAWAIAAAVLLGDTGDLFGFRERETFWPFLLTTVVLCTAWALLVGRGPLERLVAGISRRAAPDRGDAGTIGADRLDR